MEKKILIKKNLRKKEKVNTNGRKRNPGIDLLRLIGMFDIVFFHTEQNSDVKSKYRKYFKQLELISVFCNCHISIFGIISGAAGYKTHKYSNLMHLWLIVFFYSLTIHYAYEKYNHRSNVQFSNYYFPLIYCNHWYFSTYFGMYLFLPIINRGIAYMNKKEFAIMLFFIVTFLMFWNDYMEHNDDAFRLSTGRTITGLTIFYLIGVFFGKFILIENKFRNIIYYIIYLIVFIASGRLSFYYANEFYGGNKYQKILKKMFNAKLNSFGMVFMSVSLLLLFGQIKYNEYLGKIITFFGQLAFSVYIIHDHPDIRYIIFKSLFNNYSYNLSLENIIYILLQRAIKVFVICIAVDCIRHFLFKLLRIRNICIYLEKGIIFIFGKIPCLKG